MNNKKKRGIETVFTYLLKFQTDLIQPNLMKIDEFCYG